MSKFSDTIDFSKYGLKWNITDKIKRIPDNFFHNISSVKDSNNTISLTTPSGNNVVFNYGAELGHGSYGVTYPITEKIDGQNAIVKIITNKGGKDFILDTIQEVLMQIIIFEATKDVTFPEIGLTGPFGPRFFYFGKDADKLYIIMEKMDGDFHHLFRSTDGANGIIPKAALIKNTTLQMAQILKYLYEKLHFNHRDFKADNIMFAKKADGTLNVRLIDFGFSCLYYKNLFLHSMSTDIYSTRLHCNSRSRDLHSYFRYLLDYTFMHDETCYIKRVIEALMASDQAEPTNWPSTYVFYNAANDETSLQKSANLDVSVVYDVFLALDLLSPDEPCSMISGSWSSKLVKVYNNTVQYLTDKEFLQIPLQVSSSFIKKYLSSVGNLQTAWLNNKSKNALITKFKYTLPVLTFSRDELDLPTHLVPVVRSMFIENASLLKMTDGIAETILHKIARNPGPEDINALLDTVLAANSEPSFMFRTNMKSESPLSLALENNFTYFIRKYVTSGKLLHYIESNSALIKNLMDKSPEIYVQIDDHNTLLLILCKLNSSKDLISKVLQTNPAIGYLDTYDQNGYTALDIALKNDDKFLIEKLFELGKDSPKTLFNYLNIKEPAFLAHLFSKYFNKARINDKEKYTDKTLLIKAVNKNNEFLVDLLLSNNAKTGLRDNYGRTALHYAATNSSIFTGKDKTVAFDIVKKLLEANPALPNIKNSSFPKSMGPGNPHYATDPEVRAYIKSRKSGFFTKKANTNVHKGGKSRRLHRNSRISRNSRNSRNNRKKF